MPVRELNISSSEQSFCPPLWSESVCHTLRLPTIQPQYLYYLRRARMHEHMYAHALAHKHKRRSSRHKSFLLCIDLASTGR